MIELSDAVALIVSAVGGVVSIIAIWRSAVVEKQLHLFRQDLDQSIIRLHRLRDLVVDRHTSELYLTTYNHLLSKTGKQNYQEVIEPKEYSERYARISALSAEIRGLAFSIQDQELLTLPRDPKEL